SMAGECSEEQESPSSDDMSATTGPEKTPKMAIDGQSIETATPTPSPPDRNDFQSHLGDINASIGQLTKRLNQLVGRNSSSSLISEASTRKKSILNQREDLKKETDRTKAELEEKLKTIEDIRSQMKHLEPELHWKNMVRLDKDINRSQDMRRALQIEAEQSRGEGRRGRIGQAEEEQEENRIQQLIKPIEEYDAHI
ncbi:hypothetical protein PMAYCL1PPCAC_00868, partial [Pristionchus mayeri]